MVGTGIYYKSKLLCLHVNSCRYIIVKCKRAFLSCYKMFKHYENNVITPCIVRLPNFVDTTRKRCKTFASKERDCRLVIHPTHTCRAIATWIYSVLDEALTPSVCHQMNIYLLFRLQNKFVRRKNVSVMLVCHTRGKIQNEKKKNYNFRRFNRPRRTCTKMSPVLVFLNKNKSS